MSLACGNRGGPNRRWCSTRMLEARSYMRVLIWLCQRHLRSRDLSAQPEGRVFLKIYLVEPKRLTLCPNSVEYLIAQLHSGSLICGMMLGSITRRNWTTHFPTEGINFTEQFCTVIVSFFNISDIRQLLQNGGGETLRVHFPNEFHAFAQKRMRRRVITLQSCQASKLAQSIDDSVFDTTLPKNCQAFF